MAITHLYKFDNNLTNSVGGNNASQEGTVTYNKGIRGNCIQFDRLPYPGNLINYGAINNFTYQPFTYSFLYYPIDWISSISAQSGGHFLVCNGSWQTNGYQITSGAGGVIILTFQPGAYQATSGEYSIELNKWYYVVLTRNGSSVKIYINGVNRVITPGTHINPSSVGGGYLYSNGQNTGYKPMSSFKMDDFITDNRDWTASEVKNQYSYYKGFF